MENRKLVFSEQIKQRERKRVRNFTITTIVIGLILCTLVIPLLALKSYENDKKVSESYTNIAKYIWYNGVKEIEYDELSIKVFVTDIEYESIYTKGICSVSDKVQVMLYMDNIRIVQRLNSVTIQKGEREIRTLKFLSDGKENVIEKNKITYVIFEIVSIIIYIFLVYLSITLYKSAENKRMIIDMNKQ